MATDDERREAARRLRGQANKLGPNMDAHEFAHYTADVIDVDECMTWHEMTLLLADLIEPSERACHYYDSDTNRCGCYDTRLVDRDALLELVKELELGAQCFVGRKWPDVECERAGKHLADDYEMPARRIREALGVES